MKIEENNIKAKQVFEHSKHVEFQSDDQCSIC